MNLKQILFSSGIVLGIFLGFSGSASAAIIPVHGYAWSDNIGWVQFDPLIGGVQLDDSTGKFSGYAWSDNIGWIDFSPVAGFPQAPNHGVELNTANGKVDGWARAVSTSGGWDGWINTRDLPTYEVNVDYLGTGDFSGYAWGSDVVGWLSFNGFAAGNPYKVTLNPAALPPPGPTLTVDLTANPVSGAAPLTSILTATVGGTAVGTINYKFDCDNDGIYEQEINNSLNNPETYSCVYAVAGNYTARVYVERDIAASAEDTVAITVGAALPPSPDFSLNNSNAIYATVVGGVSSDSSNTQITIIPQLGFDKQIRLSVQSVNPALPGASFNFSDDRLDSAEYVVGSSFNVSVPASTLKGVYDIIIQGISVGAGSITRTVSVKLNVEAFNPGWHEI